MNKVIYEILISPLGLPLPIIWEYILLAIIEGIAFRIAWNVSPGGPAGSLIHYLVRIPAVFIFWAFAYAIIAFAKWIIQNWIIALCVTIGILVLIYAIVIFTKYAKKQERM